MPGARVMAVLRAEQSRLEDTARVTRIIGHYLLSFEIFGSEPPMHEHQTLMNFLDFKILDF